MKPLNIHAFMHVPYEGLGCMEHWILEKKHNLTYTKFYNNDKLPALSEIDWLIVMGGPMGVYDETEYPWLSEEKSFIKNVIDSGKTVLGICLGSQLIAEVLSAKVYPNKQKEIGWFDLQVTEEGKSQSLLNDFENSFPVFHWHGDTFDLPQGSINLFQSAVTKHQAFLINEKVLGLQFHFEVTAKTLNEMVENGMTELIESETVQSASDILLQTANIEANNRKMYKILDYLSGIK